jgi:hypothetical protein
MWFQKEWSVPPELAAGSTKPVGNTMCLIRSADADGTDFSDLTLPLDPERRVAS